MQTPDNNQHRQDEALDAPPRLVAALKRLPKEPVFIPPTADETVLRAAQRYLSAQVADPECARPRAQQAPTGPTRLEDPRSRWLRKLLRPGTGALRGDGLAALRWARLSPWAVTAAAVVLLLVAVPQFYKRPAPEPDRDSVLAQGDLNHDGRVDILDAFALARQLKQGNTRNLQLDVNGDGVVDERDVAALAARAVKLERGGRS